MGDEPEVEGSVVRSPNKGGLRKSSLSFCVSPNKVGKLSGKNARQSRSGRFTVSTGHGKKTNEVDAAVLQALGGVGNASMLDDDEELPVRVLLYRLVALSTDGPWRDGLLLELARSTDDDAELGRRVFELMEQEWRMDPIRLGLGPRPPRMTSESHVGSTWSHVLLDGRGTVGETALHLCCLLATPEHKRLIHVLVPWLAKQRVTDTGGADICALDATYIGQPYNGEVALHFAVIAQDTELVKLLVESGASVHAHASGDFLYSNPKLYFGGTIVRPGRIPTRTLSVVRIVAPRRAVG